MSGQFQSRPLYLQINRTVMEHISRTSWKLSLIFFNHPLSST